MIRNNSRTEDEQKKELARSTTTTSRVASSASSSSRQWSSFRDPRIVRASRAFGRKDRHSKVCTVRGLRDRRIRLSVPTAVELYDLQEKLGVSQPSKVIDWLLDATKQDIDKLPPLQMPLGFGGESGSRNLIGNLRLLPHELNTSRSFFPIRINGNFVGEDETPVAKSSKFWGMDSGLRTKSKEVVQKDNLDEKGKSIDLQKNQLYAQSFFPVPYSFNQWDPSNFSMSQFGNHHGFQLQTEHLFNLNSTPMPMPMPSFSSTLPLGSQSFTFPSYPSNYLTPESRQMNQFPGMNAGSSQQILPTPFMPILHPPLRSFQTNADSTFLHHQDNDGSKEGDSGNDS